MALRTFGPVLPHCLAVAAASEDVQQQETGRDARVIPSYCYDVISVDNRHMPKYFFVTVSHTVSIQSVDTPAESIQLADMLLVTPAESIKSADTLFDCLHETTFGCLVLVPSGSERIPIRIFWRLQDLA